MELKQEVREEIDNFREAHLPCKKSRICLPLYVGIEKIRHHDYDKNEAKNLFENGLSLYNKINDKRKKHIMNRLYWVINNEMNSILHPGESNIKPECENHDCPVYSIIWKMDGGDGFKEFITAQTAAMYVYKYKESEKAHHDLGEEAIKQWAGEKININGKETTLAAEFRKDYEIGMGKEIEEFKKNHPKVKRSLIEKIKKKIIKEI